MSKVRGKVAVVTGAGSGIGRELALCLADRGARLALCDIDELGLGETADRVKAGGAEVYASRVDVGDRAAVETLAAEVAERFGAVHQVYNNAGVASPGSSVLESEWADFDRVLRVDLFGVIHGTKAFLPHLIASGDGHVVNVSSLNGLLALPGAGGYCAAKFGVRGFTEALRAELLVAGHPVRVSVVHPGGVRTGIKRNERERRRREGREMSPEEIRRSEAFERKLLRMAPERAARTVVDGVEANRARILVGGDARNCDRLVRLAPVLAPRLAAWFARRTYQAV
ncbi:SDR family NAD(P)-dependent oxidoreductase [Streptomyces abyssomicinicus]|uniref:SDR family NAD(P)-dependent oxidoreductase n=1 Tax=Streptomyces abyssomicinicus TaxID=574929 RepID=UPI00124FD8A8|nr:SDR family NAD(P)-dependent oxidoreductase [Streptomyces abyssomicinicus]